MDIVYAAEKPSIAKLLGEHMKRRVAPEEIRVSENPDETGSFYIGFQFDHFVMSPDGKIQYKKSPAPGGALNRTAYIS